MATRAPTYAENHSRNSWFAASRSNSKFSNSGDDRVVSDLESDVEPLRVAVRVTGITRLELVIPVVAQPYEMVKVSRRVEHRVAAERVRQRGRLDLAHHRGERGSSGGQRSLEVLRRHDTARDLDGRRSIARHSPQ